MTEIERLHEEVKRLRALKLPASQQVHNLTKALYEDAGVEISELRSAIERKDAALRIAFGYVEWAANATNDVNDGDGVIERIAAALADEKEGARNAKSPSAGQGFR